MRLLSRRVAAYALDVLLLFAVLAPAGVLVNAVLGNAPRTGPEIWRPIVWNFSVPVWIYFVAGDGSASGATLGKKLLKLQIRRLDNRRLSWARALGRTAVRLVPWELTHVSAFALSTGLDRISGAQAAGLGAANVLIVVYLGIAAATQGQRSLHDLVAGTLVREVVTSSAATGPQLRTR
jgi:uncharacterized RDD family membrane protein YckC